MSFDREAAKSDDTADPGKADEGDGGHGDTGMASSAGRSEASAELTPEERDEIRQCLETAVQLACAVAEAAEGGGADAGGESVDQPCTAKCNKSDDAAGALTTVGVKVVTTETPDVVDGGDRKDCGENAVSPAVGAISVGSAAAADAVDAKCSFLDDGNYYCRCDTGDPSLSSTDRTDEKLDRADSDDGGRCCCGGAAKPALPQSAFGGGVNGGTAGQKKETADILNKYGHEGREEGEEEKDEASGMMIPARHTSPPVSDVDSTTGTCSSSSGSLGGCTTVETQGRTDDARDSGRSAFGSDCSDGSVGSVSGEFVALPGNGNAFSRLDRPREESTESSPAAAEENMESAAAAAATAAAAGSSREASGSSSSPPEACEAQDAAVVEEDGAGVRSEDRDDAITGDRNHHGSASEEGATDVGQTEQAGCRENADDRSSNVTADAGGEGGGVGAAPPSSPGAAAAASANETIHDDTDNPLNRLVEPPVRTENSDRRQNPTGVDLYSCLDHFMAEEALIAADGNGYDCEKCRSRPSPPDAVIDGDGNPSSSTVKPSKPSKQDAKKRLLMMGEPPGVLVCHLKRLQARRKVNRNVEFPVDLDMAPFFWQDPKVRKGRGGGTMSKMPRFGLGWRIVVPGKRGGVLFPVPYSHIGAPILVLLVGDDYHGGAPTCVVFSTKASGRSWLVVSGI